MGGKMEFRDIYDKEGNITRHRLPAGVNLHKGEYLRMVEAWIVDRKNRILLQQRSFGCIIYPGYWTLTTGHFQSGESTEDACIREIKEELGITVKPKNVQLIDHITRDTDEHLLWDIVLVKKTIRKRHMKINPVEVNDVRWVTTKQLREIVNDDNVFYYPEMMDIIDYIENIDA